MKKICNNCQYFRDEKAKTFPMTGDYWCSNSKSDKFRFKMTLIGDPDVSHIYLQPTDTCDQFSLRGKKAPLWMRAMIKIVGKK